MPPLSVLIKPASGKCNMRCKYCFYADEMNNRSVQDFGEMSEETMEQIIIKCLDFAEDSCTFGFQGGEPTLRGLDFFRKFVELVHQHNTKPTQVHFALQTNGLLLNEHWAQFFHDNKFLIGLSIDGDKDAHDLHRVDALNKGTFTRVLKSAKLLEQYKVEFNILTVITAYTARHIKRIYSFLMKNGLTYQQYIPCLDPLEEKRGLQPYSLTPALYGDFLIRLFDCWYKDRKADTFVYIRYFENLAAVMLGHPPESCGMLGYCSIQSVIEADGSVYPCDFYMLDQYKIGNFNTDTFLDMEQAREDCGFLKESVKGLAGCTHCKFYRVCRGGCRRDRQGMHMEDIGHNYFCESYKKFFEHALPKLATLLR